jgi:hypothetical protein
MLVWHDGQLLLGAVDAARLLHCDG